MTASFTATTAAARTLGTAAVLFAALLLATRAAGAAAPTAAADLPNLAYASFRLDNGLEVILHEDHRLPLVAVSVWYHVGPARETAGRTGFAHLFEHLMFEGSRHVPGNTLIQHLERAGASDVNGTTDFDRTAYFETLPSSQLELALWLESDRMGYLLDGLDAGKLMTQRDVVRNERRQTTEGEPYGLVEEALYQELFPAGHPYHANVIGSHADIESARLPDVRAFARTYYTPSNASLTIAGDIDPAAARRLVERYFGSIPAGPALPAAAVDTPPIAAERRRTVTDRVPVPRLYLGWITAPVFAPGDAEADLLAQVLGGGRSSRLYKRLVRELELAQEVTARVQNLQFGSVFTIEVTAQKGVLPAALLAAVDAELDRLRRDGVTATELERARTTVRTDSIARLERLGGIAEDLNRYAQLAHDPGYLAADLARYEAVSAADLAALARGTLRNEARVVIEGVPGERVVEDVPRTAAGAESAGAVEVRMADEPWRAHAPPARPGAPVAPPAPRRFTLGNGLTVFVAGPRSLPLVNATLIVDAGTSSNPADRPGLASLTAALLEEGTASRSADEIADRAALLGTSLSARTGRDTAQVSLEVLASRTGDGLELLADVVRHPRLAADDLERVRRLRDDELRQAATDPRTAARHVLLGALYGADHPYGFPDAGTPGTLGRVTIEDVRNLWNARYQPGRSALVLCGDLDEAAARALAERYFGDWPATTSAATAVPPVVRRTRPAFYLIDRPGAPQSAVAIGGLGPARATPDYVPLEVTNNVLGGLFSSRLNLDLRERRGYTYGALSLFRYARGAGYFSVESQVRTDVTGPAIAAALRDVAGMRRLPASDEELRLARGAFAESVAALFETPGSTAQALGELYVYGLPGDYYATLPGLAAGVTVDDVSRMAARHLSLPDRTVVVAGDRRRIGRSLGRLGLGRPVVVDDNGVPVASARRH
jgi:zinc protease